MGIPLAFEAGVAKDSFWACCIVHTDLSIAISWAEIPLTQPTTEPGLPGGVTKPSCEGH